MKTENDPAQQHFEQLADNLLNCAEEEFADWLGAYRSELSLAFLQYLKDSKITSTAVLHDYQKMDRATRYILYIAAALPNELMAMALAQWMRGLWAMHNHAADAVILFRSALPAYEEADDRLSVAKLSANLVGVLADVNKNKLAKQFYKRAQKVFLDYVDKAPEYLVVLEQNYGYLLHYWGRYVEALVVHDQALALVVRYNLMTRNDLAATIAEIRVNRHLTLGRLGRFAEVEAGFLQDRVLAEKAGQPITVARIDMDLGELYTILGRPMEALGRFQVAARDLVPMEQGPVLATQATLLRQLGAFRRALTQYEAALELLKPYGLKTFYAETLVNLASCLRQDGDDKELRYVDELLNRAENIWKEENNPYWLVQIYFERIRLAQVQNKLNRAVTLLDVPVPFLNNPQLQAEFRVMRAETYQLAGDSQDKVAVIVEDYETALAYANQQGAYWLRRAALHGLGREFLKTDWPKARQFLEKAAETDDRMRQLLSIEELKASFHAQADNLYDDLILGAFAQQEYELLLHYVWRAKASAFLDLALRQRQSENDSEAERQKIVQLHQQIAALRGSMAKESQRNLPDDVREAASPELNNLVEQLWQLRLQSQQKAGVTSDFTQGPWQNVLTKMDADLLLEYVRCGNDIYGICAMRSGVCAVKWLGTGEAIEELAGWLGQSFGSFQQLTPGDRQRVASLRIVESRRYLARCYDDLVDPLLSEIVDMQDIHKILIAPCDVMALLPFAAFWTGESYWIENQEIELIQSGALLGLEKPEAAEYSEAVVVGASAGKVTEVLQEARCVASLLPGSRLVLDAPMLEELNALHKPPQILHIAAHTIERGDAPLLTGIQLGGEVLSVAQSFELPLWGTTLVTLSGCTTAGGIEGEIPLFAFQSALLIAGAKRVLCTLWRIADGVACTPLVCFYQLLQQGVDPPAALRQMQLQLLQSVEYEHPALWAAFTMIRR